MSLEAPFTSSSFGASVAISSLVGALALTALARADACGDPAVGDLGGLLLATILGITYIDFMAVLVIWYGDLPHEEIWFVARDRWPWNAVARPRPSSCVRHSRSSPLLLAKVRNGRGRCAWSALRVGRAALLRRLSDCAAGGWRALQPASLPIIGIGLALVRPVHERRATPALVSRSPPMPAEEHIHYVPESPAVDTRIVLWCALGALLLLAGAIGGLYAVYDRRSGQRRAGPASISAAARRHLPSRYRGIAPPRRRAKPALETWRWANDQHTLVKFRSSAPCSSLAQKGGDA